MTLLLITSAAFLFLHIGISSTPLRSILIGWLGDNGYLGLYSVLAFASLGGMIYAFVVSTPETWFYATSPSQYLITKVLMFFAIVLIVVGNMTKNPTAVKMEGALGSPLPGALKITRHPLQWGILLFSVGHLVSNGDEVSVLFFGTLAVVSGVGMLAIDRRKLAEPDAAWAEFYSQTSMVPFAALIQGKSRLAMADINWLPIGIGAALYVGIYFGHEFVSGVSLY